ncbi:homospermidine synthase [Prosthecomicrobium pneumaticum]|uniref:Homospermidine synthase n=1 Tax=Prosthecomicrobium pneumaticum TaxID=81895 RepID=A0A7W9CVQ4_9HYPH|nr:homospermidine synthase [Prosthecomicrobium pneumaticum]MBB5752478.1 homospermidine synthase [Prosthecomicrobium pneumaticum]
MTTPADWPIYGTIDGPIVMIGFGSIGRGVLPLLERHFRFDKDRFVVIAPDDRDRRLLDERGIRFIHQGLTRDNYRDLLSPLLTAGEGRGFCVNLSVDTGSVDILRLCRELGTLYIDTVIEPWPGFYYDRNADTAARTNYALRETLMAEKRARPGGPTAVSTCGANPGMVSWLVKQALLDIARDTGRPVEAPTDRAGWAALMRGLGVKGVHVAERDTQRSRMPKPDDTFVNTWSVDGLLSEGMQPAELGWGTHERWMPDKARRHAKSDAAAIYLLQPGADTRVRTWCPISGPQFGFLVTHNEAISISDYYSVHEDGALVYRPTCHYAYHPSNDAVLSLHELFGQAGQPQGKQHILSESEIVGGRDELGVLLYGHARNAYWYGSRLTIEEARTLAPYQNATGLQVTSAVMAGMVWALENPAAGIVEADEMDFARCLSIQRRYLGTIEGHYTDWTPLDGRPGFFPEDLDRDDPWQFRNILVR